MEREEDGMDDDQNSRGQRIRKIRESLHLTRHAFSQMTGFAYGSLRELETGGMVVNEQKAKLLSLIFMYRFALTNEEAGIEFILHGNDKQNPT